MLYSLTLTLRLHRYPRLMAAVITCRAEIPQIACHTEHNGQVAYDEHLANRIREVVLSERGVTEQRISQSTSRGVLVVFEIVEE